jgi:hypothetical protein
MREGKLECHASAAPRSRGSPAVVQSAFPLGAPQHAGARTASQLFGGETGLAAIEAAKRSAKAPMR